MKAAQWCQPGPCVSALYKKETNPTGTCDSLSKEQGLPDAAAGVEWAKCLLHSSFNLINPPDRQGCGSGRTFTWTV